MRKLTTIRFDEQDLILIKRLQKKLRISQSAIIRLALQALAERENV